MSIGLLIVRLVVGALFVGHGTQKLFGWFGGGGRRGTGQFFEQKMGYRPGHVMATLAGMTEAGSGALLMVGLFTPLAAAGIIGVMVNAIIDAHWPNGLWVTNGGFEYPLVNATIATAIAFIGPGLYSLDRAIGWRLWGVPWGVGAVALGTATAAMTLASRRSTAATSTDKQRRAA